MRQYRDRSAHNFFFFFNFTAKISNVRTFRVRFQLCTSNRKFSLDDDDGECNVEPPYNLACCMRRESFFSSFPYARHTVGTRARDTPMTKSRPKNVTDGPTTRRAILTTDNSNDATLYARRKNACTRRAGKRNTVLCNNKVSACVCIYTYVTVKNLFHDGDART